MAEPIRTVGIVGAGTMGAGIAQKLAQEGARVVLVDLDDARAAAGLARVRASLDEAVERKIFDRTRADAALARIEGTADFARLAEADLAIETVFEDLAAKRQVFERLGRTCREDAILATNTSSFRVAGVASAAARPERVLGLHFFYHPAKNRLVEVVPHEGTDPAALDRARALMERTGKIPIASKDSPGFAVNRWFVPWLNEAARILDEGWANVATIEAAAKQTFGVGMGPFELMNVTGLPVALHSAESLERALGPFYAPSEALRAQVASGKPWDLAGEVSAGSVEEVQAQLLGVVFLVAAEMLDEEVARPDDVDLGARVGLRWWAGPLELMNGLGIAKAADLAEFAGESFERALPKPLAARRRSGEPFRLERVRLEVADGLAVLTIARPDALNALDERTVDELAARFREAEARADVRGVVIRGMGKAFVAGADVKWFVRQLDREAAGEPGIEEIVRFTERAQALYRSFERSPKVVVAAVEGLSLGGGSELALACDYILATERGSLGFPETGIGIYPGLGGAQRLPRRVGRGLARWLIHTGRTLGAKVAVATSAFDALVAPEDVLQAARKLAAQGKRGERAPRDPATLPPLFARAAQVFDVPAQAILDGKVTAEDKELAKDLERVRTQKAPVALRIADELIARALDRPIDEGLAEEVARLREVFSTADAREGLAKVGGPERPRFTGA